MIKLLKPCDPWYIVQKFGVKSPAYKTYHHGIDVRIRNVPNKRITCALGGSVYKVGTDTTKQWYTNGKKNKHYGKGSPYGVHVRIVSEVNGQRYYTLYGHLESTALQVGQHVDAGQIIGKGGTSGKSSGPHLHFEIRKDRDWLIKAFNPEPYFVDTLNEDNIPEWGRGSWAWGISNKILSDKSVFDAPLTKGEFIVLLRRYHNKFK